MYLTEHWHSSIALKKTQIHRLSLGQELQHTSDVLQSHLAPFEGSNQNQTWATSLAIP